MHVEVDCAYSRFLNFVEPVNQENVFLHSIAMGLGVQNFSMQPEKNLSTIVTKKKEI